MRHQSLGGNPSDLVPSLCHYWPTCQDWPFSAPPTSQASQHPGRHASSGCCLKAGETEAWGRDGINPRSHQGHWTEPGPRLPCSPGVFPLPAWGRGGWETDSPKGPVSELPRGCRPGALGAAPHLSGSTDGPGHSGHRLCASPWRELPGWQGGGGGHRGVGARRVGTGLPGMGSPGLGHWS